MKTRKKGTTNHKQKIARKAPAIKASRKSCDAEGAGLSHYILLDKKARS